VDWAMLFNLTLSLSDAVQTGVLRLAAVVTSDTVEAVVLGMPAVVTSDTVETGVLGLPVVVMSGTVEAGVWDEYSTVNVCRQNSYISTGIFTPLKKKNLTPVSNDYMHPVCSYNHMES